MCKTAMGYMATLQISLSIAGISSWLQLIRRTSKNEGVFSSPQFCSINDWHISNLCEYTSDRGKRIFFPVFPCQVLRKFQSLVITGFSFVFRRENNCQERFSLSSSNRVDHSIVAIIERLFCNSSNKINVAAILRSKFSSKNEISNLRHLTWKSLKIFHNMAH